MGLALWRPRGGSQGCVPIGRALPDLPGWGSGPFPPSPSSGGPSLFEPMHTAGVRFPVGSSVMALPDRARRRKCGRSGDCGTPGDGAQAESLGLAYSPRAGTPRCAGHQRVRPDHDRVHATMVGEASNPGPAILLPRDFDAEHTSRFAVFGEGCVVFVFEGPLVQIQAKFYAFRAKVPLGGRFAILTSREAQLFRGLVRGGAYVCAGARLVQPHWEGAREFLVGHPGSSTAVVRVGMAPWGIAWKMGHPRSEGEPRTHADLACGIGDFTVAAQSLGVSTTWACGGESAS